jgi:multiple sugar transport system ATP-binding protein
VESSGTGREVIVGLRPENFEDLALVPPHKRPHGITFHADIDVLESLGSDVFVYFSREVGKGVSSAELEELARDSGRADSGAGGETIVARLDAATRIAEGQDAELWVDSRAMHIFDPATGRNLSLAGDGDGGATSVQPTSTSGAEAVQPEAAQPEAVQPETVDPNATATDIRAVPGQAGQGGEAT